MPLQIQRLIEIGDTLSSMFINLNENSTRHVLSNLVGSRSDSQENRGAIFYLFFIFFINNKYFKRRSKAKPPDDSLLTFMKVIIYIYIYIYRCKERKTSFAVPNVSLNSKFQPTPINTIFLLFESDFKKN